MLYHVSPTAGIKILQPRVSTHGKAYVYAIENLVTGLLFGAKKDDFDFLLYADEKGTPVIYECYPDALKAVYQGKKCSVYLLNEDGFLRNQTSWSVERVCEKEVPVVEELVIDDLYSRLLEEEKEERLIIHRYEYDAEYRKIIAGHVVDRLIRFDMDLDRITETDNRFSEYFRGIVEGLRQIKEGHLLP